MQAFSHASEIQKNSAKINSFLQIILKAFEGSPVIALTNVYCTKFIIKYSFFFQTAYNPMEVFITTSKRIPPWMGTIGKG